MADRILDSEWPEYVNSSGVPGTGTKVTAEVLDSIKAAVSASIYDPNLDDDPVSIAQEVDAARGAYSSLDARLAAVEALASGGAAVPATPGQRNLIPNGNFLIWGAGKSAVPTFWQKTASLTVAWATAQGLAIADARRIPGCSIAKLSSPNTSGHEMFIDLLSTADLSTYGSFPLAGLTFSVGLHVKTANGAGAVKVFIDDGTAASTTDGNQACATAAGTDWQYISGSRTLSGSATRLRIVIRVTVTENDILVAGAGCYQSSSADRYIPPEMTVGDLLYAEPGGAVPTGVKAFWYPSRPIFITEAIGYCVSGSGTVKIQKGASTLVFASNVPVAVSPSDQIAANVADASFDTTDKLTIEVTASSSMTTPTVRVKYLAFCDPWQGHLAGRRSIA